MGASPPPKLSPSAAPSAEDEDRATVVPDFDPDAFARDTEIRERASSLSSSESSIEQARHLHASRQYEQALFVLTRLLQLAPLHQEATDLHTACREALERECVAALGSHASILVLAISPDELKRFALDHVSGFLVSLLDGATTVEEIVDISGLPALLALRHLRNLLERGLIGVASGTKRL